MEDYANLCNRSLSAFKRDFKVEFGKSPLQWLIEERLKYAKIRLLSIEESITELALYSAVLQQRPACSQITNRHTA